MEVLVPMSKNREQEILQKSLALLVQELSPQKIYLFGSRAKEKVNPGSDFDFAIEGDPPSAQKKREIREQIESIAGLYSVDLIFLSEVDKSFKDLILETGKLLYDSERGPLLPL